MTKHSVVVENVGKKFSANLKDGLKYGLYDAGLRLLGQAKVERLREGEFWALQSINFKLSPGDALGIMGVNGSGKTTLLRILNGTYSPDTGKVILKGRIGALIAAGAGFSPMLSGRENIYISAALLGMSPREVTRKFDEIVDFADLGEFIDMPIRNYSSGMAVRLGFAIAAIGTPEILLVDEVLAVGDLGFQKKCYERIQQMREAGATILLVSHAPGSIWTICDQAIVIHHGISSGVLSVEDACREYENNNLLDYQKNTIKSDIKKDASLPSLYGGNKGGTGSIFIKALKILNELNEEVGAIRYGEGFKLQFYIVSQERIEGGILRVQIDSEMHKALSIIDSYEVTKNFYDFNIGSHVFEISINKPNLRPGAYSFCGSILKKGVDVHLYFEYALANLVVLSPKEIFFYADFRASVHLDANFSQIE